MAVLQLDDQLFPLTADATRIGAGTEADVALPGDVAAGVLAIVDRIAPDALVIRRAHAEAVVRVNGVLLGAEPTPLMHGDRVELAGHELRFADDSKRGATQYVTAHAMASLGGVRRGGNGRATAASGGRLVSLVDGKEYTVPASGLVIGRDAACDVVVARNDVSRRHAQIAPADHGYLLRDTSANGVWVNGERVQGSHRLAPADVIRLGTEEFRFHADVLPADPAPAVNVESADAEEAPPAVSRPAEPAAIVTQTDERPVLATLEVINEGPARGSRYFIRTSVAQVGRGAHNDVRLPDESVSETHARLQRRDDGWYAVDLDSTNGTYVGGSRVTTERLLNDAPDVRFGGVKLRFLPSQPSSGDTVPSSSGGDSAAADRRRLASSMAQPASDPEGVGAPTTRWLLVLLALATTVATFFVLKGRS